MSRIQQLQAERDSCKFHDNLMNSILNLPFTSLILNSIYSILEGAQYNPFIKMFMQEVSALSADEQTSMYRSLNNEPTTVLTTVLWKGFKDLWEYYCYTVAFSGLLFLMEITFSRLRPLSYYCKRLKRLRISRPCKSNSEPLTILHSGKLSKNIFFES